jgi:hypothetical protein
MIRKYPIGLQSFRKIREGSYLYIDKTEIIHRLVETGKYYFRPFRNDSRKKIAVGVNFSSEKKAVSEYQVKQLD